MSVIITEVNFVPRQKNALLRFGQTSTHSYYTRTCSIQGKFYIHEKRSSYYNDLGNNDESGIINVAFSNKLSSSKGQNNIKSMF